MSRSRPPEDSHQSDDPDLTKGRLALSDTDAARALGIGKTLCRQLIASGELGSFRCGRRLLVPVKEVQRYIARRMMETAR